MSEFKQYKRSQIAELREWEPGDDVSAVSISAVDKELGSPKAGDMIARNPANHGDQWLVAAAYFAVNFEPAMVFTPGNTAGCNSLPGTVTVVETSSWAGQPNRPDQEPK